jgi:hypothetical protein
MSEPKEISAVPEANHNSRPIEAEPEASGQVSTKKEMASDVEVLAQPKQRETVPRSQRRGFLASITIVSETTNAFEYSNGKKWLFTVIVALAGTTSSTGSSILYRKYLFSGQPWLQKTYKYLADQVD